MRPIIRNHPIKTLELLKLWSQEDHMQRKQPEQMSKSTFVLVVVYLWPNLLRDKG